MGSLSTDKIANEIYEAASRRDEKRRTYLGMSSIGRPCSRELWYGFRGFSGIPFEGRTLMIFEFGHLIESEMVRLLRQAGYKIEGQQDGFYQHNGFFRGHWDGKILGVTSRPHVLEIKSCNKSKFKAFQDFGVQKTESTYYSQVQVYMHYSGLERALFVICCKDNSQVYSERVYYHKEDAETLHKKAYEIITANDPPERAFDQKSQECGWCAYRYFCWDEGMIMADDRTCGSCWYQTWKGLDPICRHPDHPVMIRTWGISCDEWSYMLEKEMPHIDLGRKEKVPLDMIGGTEK